MAILGAPTAAQRSISLGDCSRLQVQAATARACSLWLEGFCHLWSKGRRVRVPRVMLIGTRLFRRVGSEILGVCRSRLERGSTQLSGFLGVVCYKYSSAPTFSPPQSAPHTGATMNGHARAHGDDLPCRCGWTLATLPPSLHLKLLFLRLGGLRGKPHWRGYSTLLPQQAVSLTPSADVAQAEGHFSVCCVPMQGYCT